MPNTSSQPSIASAAAMWKPRKSLVSDVEQYARPARSGSGRPSRDRVPSRRTPSQRPPVTCRRMPRATSSRPQITSPAEMAPGNSAAPNFWPGITGKALDVPEHDRAQERKQRSQDPCRRPSSRYLAMPTAFITAPRSSSDFSMKAANSADGAQMTPKPRCFMKSLNSALLCTFSSAASSLSPMSFGRPLAPRSRAMPPASSRCRSRPSASAR